MNIDGIIVYISYHKGIVYHSFHSPSPLGERARGGRLESLSCINYSVFFLLPGIYCRSSSR